MSDAIGNRLSSKVFYFSTSATALGKLVLDARRRRRLPPFHPQPQLITIHDQ